MPSIEKPVGDAAIAIDPAIAKERPVAANVFEQLEIAASDQNLLLIVRGFGDDASERIGEERSAPEFQTFAGSAIPADVAELVADTVHYAHEHAIGDRMRALDGAPG